MCHKIYDGAIFISDAHENERRDGFLKFLQKLQNREIKTTQLFLMGDMFDLLVGEVDYTKKIFKKHIDLINVLSQKIEIIYFEGNHDFNLQQIFPNVKVFKISKQPAKFNYNDKNFLLSHGDTLVGIGYDIYTLLSRNFIILKILNYIDSFTSNYISKKILHPQIDKNICYKLNNFYEIAKQKIQMYDIGLRKIDFVCEGHYHQNQEFVFEDIKYKNFSSFACDNSYYQINFEQEVSFKEII